MTLVLQDGGPDEDGDSKNVVPSQEVAFESHFCLTRINITHLESGLLPLPENPGASATTESPTPK